MPGLDPEIEGEQRERHIGLRQADFFQRAAEPQSVQQADGEGDEPGRFAGEIVLMPLLTNGLRRHEHDAERDHRLD
ncbi:MAG: hypothetical protein WBF23_04990, partial [Methyloceanibacter sp.]